ncbi:response regulator [Alkalihalophilus lindianensis]|uniref:Response regulator n=1 Tax=Alkalihalophilus lindianensis TaxID=1630542 RepID=A0ABU3X5X7_9BACI|nr:response regulator [Alkalihalophilus lindianensis]MDV2683295.1 response regulator [Alkalihalophilus lindianensis]
MKRLLVADDEDVLRMLIVDTLEEEEYHLEEAEDGVEAFALIKKNMYDLVILDYMMPKMTGVEVLIETRKLQKVQPKILMLTAKSQQQDQEKMFKEGADYFLAKPFSPMELLDIVEEIVGE